MATLVLGAAGAAIGGAVGGTVLGGLSTAVLGRAAGAAVGRVIDQRLMGQGSAAVETGRLDRLRLTGASEGSPIARIHGRMRIGGQVIWATRFQEHQATSGGGGGKGSRPRQPQVTSYSYSISLAVALCEGEISRVGRVWADGVELAADDLQMRVYPGNDTQLPDPKIEAVEGWAPAYRGTAYVVIEDLDLGPFGNRVPQFTFEVARPTPAAVGGAADPSQSVRAVAMVPGTGEYALATTPVYFEDRPGRMTPANVNSPGARTDFVTSVDALREEVPGCASVSLVVSWFGDDLRCGRCKLRPKVEDTDKKTRGMDWQVSGLARAQAQRIAQVEGRPVYGGTPADASVIEGIKHLGDAGQDVVFYPFILMEQMAENGLTDPWSGSAHQAVLPWRGRITAEIAPGRAGSPDGTSGVDQQVAAFFGAAQATDFVVDERTVRYVGPEEWSYRRFILHYAHLCKLAGGVGAFCIGSEMRGLTQLRGADGFAAVAALQALAAEVRAILGTDCKIGYAADWTEYFGYQPQDGSGDRYFHLDPLWADDNIDFIGIDNYMPLSDWRDGDEHADADWGAIHNLDYLRANIEGGEGFDWYYETPEARAAQTRSPITDEAHDEPWVWRYKDLRGWWMNAHHERIAGERQAQATDWVPGSKPIWFTELGCAAIDKGSNQPNKFLDPKSSESTLPYGSSGMRDEAIQMQYLRAMLSYWGEAAHNPVHPETGVQMLDMSRAHVWAWDARPYPAFPAQRELWSDGENYARGHWLNGRVTARPLAQVVAEVCLRAGLRHIDVSGLNGVVRGYQEAGGASGRAALQPLMLAYGFDAVERDGTLVFVMRGGRTRGAVEAEDLALLAEHDEGVEATRAPQAEVSGRLRLGFVDADADFEVRSVEAVAADERGEDVSETEVALALTRAEGQALVERWLAESRAARDTVRLAIRPSRRDLRAGDVIDLSTGGAPGLYRIDRVEEGAGRLIEAVRVTPELYRAVPLAEDHAPLRGFVAPTPVWSVLMDLPLLRGDEVPHAPHIAATATPWPGSVAVYSAPQDSDYQLLDVVSAPSVMGRLLDPLPRAGHGRLDRGDPVRVELARGQLQRIDQAALMRGGNLAALGQPEDGTWEVIQFQQAELVAPETYAISLRLRGQAGTEGEMPEVWPVGTTFVMLNGAPQQLDLSANTRNLQQHFRIGPAQRGYDDPIYTHSAMAFAGAGLRPYAPAHVRADRLDNGDLRLRWIRRTRIDGDGWEGFDVPLGEQFERYHLRLLRGENEIRSAQTGAAEWIYTAAMQGQDGAGPVQIDVAQISDRFGPGTYRRLEINV